MGNCNNREEDYKAENDLSSFSTSVLHTGPVLGLDYYNGVIATSSEDKNIGLTLANSLLSSQTNTKYLKGHSKAINCVKVGKKHNRIYSASRDLSAKVWNADDLTPIHTSSDIHTLNITALALTQSEDRFITGSRDYSVKLWDNTTYQLLQSYSVPRNIVTTLQTSPTEEQLIFQGSEDLCLRIWDTRCSPSDLPSIHITGYVYFPLSMSIHENGYHVATGCKGFDSVGCGVFIWDIRNPAQPVVEYRGHSQDVTGCQYMSGSEKEWLYTASKDGTVMAWDTTTTTTSSSSSSAATTPFRTQLTNKYITSLTLLPDHPIPTPIPNKSTTNSTTKSTTKSSSKPVKASSSDSKRVQMIVGSIDGSITALSFQPPTSPSPTITAKEAARIFEILGGTMEYVA